MLLNLNFPKVSLKRVLGLPQGLFPTGHARNTSPERGVLGASDADAQATSAGSFRCGRAAAQLQALPG